MPKPPGGAHRAQRLERFRAGLWLAGFGGKPALRVLGVALLCVPHVLGAPRAHVDGVVIDDALAKDFIRATFLANAAFWLSLGALTGIFGGPSTSPEASADGARSGSAR